MRRSLAIVVALACAGLLAALLPAPVWLRAPLLVPLVLFLPGYALAANFFPPNAASTSERTVYALTLSIAATAVAGLLTQAVLGLSREAWAIVLFGVTACAAGRALRAAAPPAPTAPRRIQWALVPALVAFALAAGIAVLAIVSASNGLREAQAKIRFTGFWLLRERTDAASGATALSVGLRSHEGKKTRYVLHLSHGGVPILTRAIELRNGERWEREFSVEQTPTGGPVIATLNREGQPYRRLDVTPE
jgi:uncharacterized membrane protein